MMRLIIIRHGQSEADLEPVRLEGNADFPLTDLGRAQAQRAAERIAKEYRLDVLYASPLRRAYATADAISKACRVPITVDPRLRERSHGLVAGLTRAEANLKYPLPPGGRKVHEAPPEGESYLDQFTRVAAVWFDLYYGPDDRTVGLVAHGGTINCLYHAALGLPPLTPASFPTGDTGLHEWHVTPGGRVVIRTANCSRHLL